MLHALPCLKFSKVIDLSIEQIWQPISSIEALHRLEDEARDGEQRLNQVMF